MYLARTPTKVINALLLMVTTTVIFEFKIKNHDTLN